MFAITLTLALALGPGAGAGSWLELDGCDELDGELLRSQTLIELGGLSPEARATVRCEDEDFVVSVTSVGGARSTRNLARTTAVGEVPERYLALELAELISSAQYAPPAEPEPEPEPESEPEPEAVTESTGELSPRRRGWVGVGARFELAGQPITASGGGALTLGGRVARYISLRAELTGLGGGRSLEANAVRVGALWGGAAILASVDVGAVVVLAGLGARAGGVWLRGVARDDALTGAQLRGFSWSPLVSAGVLIPIGARLVVTARLEGGYTARPVRGLSGGATAYAYEGPWGAAQLGLGVRFGR